MTPAFIRAEVQSWLDAGLIAGAVFVACMAVVVWGVTP